MKNIVLASQSPRRRDLLAGLVPEFKIITDDSEEVMRDGEQPFDMVCRLARQKAENVAAKLNEDALVLAADTVVALDGRVLGKPSDEEEAFSMLSALSGREHRVFTGIAITDTGSKKRYSDFECTKVKFRELTDEEIRNYIASGEPMDKAGSYGIQELGALLVEGVDGDYFNVVGLPLCKLGKILKEEFNIDLLHTEEE